MGVVIVQTGEASRAERGSGALHRTTTSTTGDPHIWGRLIPETSEVQAAGNGGELQMKTIWKMKTSDVGRDEEGDSRAQQGPARPAPTALTCLEDLWAGVF